MRLFLGVFPPVEVQRAAGEAIDALRRPGDRVSWVGLTNLHYTLRFIGEVGEDGARRTAEAARMAGAACAPFDAILGGIGAFPNARRARVLWLGMATGAVLLEALARALEAALETRGFDRDRRGFSAHLTIGRVREAEADWSQRLTATPALDPARVSFRVSTLCVVESRLNPAGSVYTVREAAPLIG